MFTTFVFNLENSIQYIVGEYANVLFKEDGKTRKKALHEVRKWIKTQTQIKRVRLDSNFLLRFLRMQKFEIKESCEILDKYLTMRCQHPTWFQNLDCRVGLLWRKKDIVQIVIKRERERKKVRMK